MESELWAARLGFCGWWQLAALPGKADGVPATFRSHPFRYIDHKEAAAIRKRPATKVATRNAKNGQRFYMDFGFLRASTATFGRPNVGTDKVVRLFDGYESYLLAVDEASRHVWVFLTESKEPPTETVTAFLHRYGHKDGGMIRCDQGGELARSEDFRTRVFKECDYVVEPTGADDPSQNGGAETWNGTFAVTVRALLYGAALSAMYWSAALVHAVFLHNVWVHSRMGRTPHEAWYGSSPDLKRLRMF